MPDLTYSQRYHRFDQILQGIAEGQQSLREQVESFSTDERIDELLRAIAKLKKRRKN